MELHIPVLAKEVIEGLNIKKDGIYLDLTLGRGGHSSLILQQLTTGRLIGVDQDEDAIEQSNERLSQISDNFILVHSNFEHINDILDNLNVPYVDGILMDLGVSSPQFDNPLRGFSYRFDSLLDMRMNRNQELTARDVVNNYSLQELTRVFKEYGEDKYSYQIAKNIVKAREKEPILTTFQLVDIIKASKPSKELKKVGHPAKQIFQALRIEVNDELGVLKTGVRSALSRLRSGGRLAIITFHSLEDRIVKNIFKEYSEVIGNRNDIIDDVILKDYQLVNRKPIIATEEELVFNKRSASAKLRIIERK